MLASKQTNTHTQKVSFISPEKSICCGFMMTNLDRSQTWLTRQGNLHVFCRGGMLRLQSTPRDELRRERTYACNTLLFLLPCCLCGPLLISSSSPA